MTQVVALSFSGGKDSCFALYELQRRQMNVACLVTTIWENNQKSVAHEQAIEKLKQQANELNMPIEFVVTTFHTYMNDFENKLTDLKKRYGIDGIAFGDMYLQGHREWGEQLAKNVSLQSLYPLWTKQENMLTMLQQFVDLGFQAKVIKIDPEKLPHSWVGRNVDDIFIRDIQQYPNVCPMGESGEYHTAVYDGPIFIDRNVQ
ncbi:MAG TPA: hypothetical protein VK079_04790 [Bacillota bacterium]|nr:hypothetical protein [Bacillota bacterium]